MIIRPACLKKEIFLNSSWNRLRQADHIDHQSKPLTIQKWPLPTMLRKVILINIYRYPNLVPS